MLVAEEAVEIRVLRRQGKSIREIARLLEVSRNRCGVIYAVTDCRTTSVSGDRASSMHYKRTSVKG